MKIVFALAQIENLSLFIEHVSGNAIKIGCSAMFPFKILA